MPTASSADDSTLNLTPPHILTERSWEQPQYFCGLAEQASRCMRRSFQKSQRKNLCAIMVQLQFPRISLGATLGDGRSSILISSLRLSLCYDTFDSELAFC